MFIKVENNSEEFIIELGLGACVGLGSGISGAAPFWGNGGYLTN
jgi:hypothetical protein